MATKSRKRLLLVEDHPDTVAYLKNRLVEEGFDVSVARRGEEAMILLRDGPRPHVVVMDINLPGIDGDHIVEWMRTNDSTSAMPVVFVTADNTARVRHLLDPRRTRCLEKPLRTRELLEAVFDLLEQEGTKD